MNLEIAHKIKEGLEKNYSLSHIKIDLLNSGYLEDDINKSIEKLSSVNKKGPDSTKFVVKDIFDRIGYGFGSPLFLNVFFLLLGAPIIIIGIMNGLKSIISIIISNIITEYSKHKSFNKKVVGISGVILGLSFIGMSLSIYFNSLVLFIVMFLLSAVSIVPYGDLYQRMFKTWMVENRKKYLINRMSISGLFITCGIVFLSAVILNRFGISGETLTLPFFDKTIDVTIYGYLIVLNAAALSIIIAGYILYFIYWKKGDEKVWINISQEIKIFFANMKDFILAHKSIVLGVLSISAIIIAIAQTLGTAYYSIFIFQNLGSMGFGGWINIAVIFILATLATFISPYITRKTSRDYGKFPMLAFGACLFSLMPLSYYYKPTLVTISIGTIVGIIGASINGVATTLIIKEIVKDNEANTFFQCTNFISIIPYLILVPLGAWIAQAFGMQTLFLSLFLTIIAIVVPGYFLVVVIAHKKKIKI